MRTAGEIGAEIFEIRELRLVEIQGTAEQKSFDRQQLNAMLDGGLAAIRKLVELQSKALDG